MGKKLVECLEEGFYNFFRPLKGKIGIAFLITAGCLAPLDVFLQEKYGWPPKSESEILQEYEEGGVGELSKKYAIPESNDYSNGR
jgi:hypothetical protein